MSRSWHPLEAEISKTLRERSAAGKKILVAVSGGRDSVVLLRLLKELSGLLRLELEVAHIHHGGEGRTKTRRNKYLKFVADLSRSEGFPFHTNGAGPAQCPADEAGLREFRRARLLEIRDKTGAEAIALAHHSDDLLETRLIRVIRGVGPEGLPAMGVQRGRWLRPLLLSPAEEVECYAKDKKLRWIEDVSNADTRFLRNFIRKKWLPLLEGHRPGAGKSLARSLDNLSTRSQVSSVQLGSLFSENGISRFKLAGLGKAGQRRVLVSYLSRMKVQDYRMSQVDEVLKRLESGRGRLEFRVAGHDWDVNAEFIRLRPESGRIEGEAER